MISLFQYWELQRRGQHVWAARCITVEATGIIPSCTPAKRRFSYLHHSPASPVSLLLHAHHNHSPVAVFKSDFTVSQNAETQAVAVLISNTGVHMLDSRSKTPYAHHTGLLALCEVFLVNASKAFSKLTPTWKHYHLPADILSRDISLGWLSSSRVLMSWRE